MDSNRIEITTSKKKTIKLILYCLGLIGVSIFVLVISEDQQMMPPIAAQITGYLSLVFFVSTLLYILYKYFDDSPRVIIDSAGITDHTSATSPGFIPWREIEGFQIKTVYSTPFLGIILKDPEYINKSSKPVSRFLNRLNRSMFKSSYMISTNALNIKFEDFTETVKKYHQKYSRD